MIAAIHARIVVATLCWLLALATSASAECAWVLWEKYSPSPEKKDIERGDVRLPPPQWTIQNAAETRVACDKIKASVWQAVVAYHKKQPSAKVESWPGGYSLTVGGENLGFTEFLCLPDTVDPRKGTK